MANRFKGLDLVVKVSEQLWMEVHNVVQEAVIKIIPQETERQKGKMVVWRSLTNSWEEKQKAKEERKDIPIWKQSSKEYQEEIRKPS